MKFGKPYHVRAEKKRKWYAENYQKEDIWFAWYPVKSDQDRYVWLECVKRQRNNIYNGLNGYYINEFAKKYYYYELRK